MDFGGAVDKAKDLLHGHEDKVDTRSTRAPTR